MITGLGHNTGQLINLQRFKQVIKDIYLDCFKRIIAVSTYKYKK